MADSTSVGKPDPKTWGPSDWPTEPERRYADWQSRLAAHYNLDVDSRTIESDAAGRIHYLTAGNPDGEAVVLLHGVTTTAATWLPMVPALTDDYRLYVPDRPGRGLSAAPSYSDRPLHESLTDYLVELFDELQLPRPHVVGNSLGGLQAFLLATDHDCVDRLSLVGAPAGVSREFPLLFRLFTVWGLNRALIWLQRRGDPVETAEEAMGAINVVDDSAIPAVFYKLLATSQDLPGRGKSLRSLLNQEGSFGRIDPIFDIRDDIVRIERPTRFVWGSEDYFWEPNVGRQVASRMPDAEFHELDDYGHMPWMEPGETVERLVRSFLES